jgi:hypothetical protein
VQAQQQVFYTGFRPTYYLVVAAVALPLALVAGWLIPSLGWYAIILGPLVGVGISEAGRWAIQRRRGQYTWLVVCGCIVLGALPRLVLSLVSLLTLAGNPAGGAYYAGGLMRLVWTIVYVVAAVGAAYARVRPGRRV